MSLSDSQSVNRIDLVIDVHLEVHNFLSFRLKFAAADFLDAPKVLAYLHWLAVGRVDRFSVAENRKKKRSGNGRKSKLKLLR